MAVLRAATQLRAAGASIDDAIRDAWEMFDRISAEDSRRHIDETWLKDREPLKLAQAS